MFDSVKSAYPGQRFSRCGRGMENMKFVELAPRVCSAGHLVDRAFAVKMMKPGVGIGLQCALEVL